MVDFDTMEEWQSFFSANFPDGVLVTLAKGSADVAPFDSSIQMLAVKVTVKDLEEDNPEIVFVNYEDDAVFTFDIDVIDDENPERMVLRTVEGRFLIMSNMLSPLQKHMVKERLEGGIFS